MRAINLAAWTLAAGTGALVGALAEAEFGFVLRHQTVPVLKPGSPNVKVLHISDIHLMPYQKHKIAFLRKLSTLKPDLVINTGDNICTNEAIDVLIDALGPLLDVPGGFVFGGNDYSGPLFKNPLRYLISHSKPSKNAPALDWQGLRDAFTARNWQDLNNKSARVETAKGTIELRGTGDAHIGADFYDAVIGSPGKDALLNIGVTHAPYQRVLDDFVNDGMEMIFAGHTHGGQVCLPVNRALVANCDLPLDQASGLSSWGGVPLHVSAGIGTNPFTPIRLFCRPEATLLTLTEAA